MITVILTFLFTSLVYLTMAGLMVWCVWCRIGRHVQGNPCALKAIVDHVVAPLFCPQSRIAEDGEETEVSPDDGWSVEELVHK